MDTDMVRKRDEQSGRFTETVSDKQIIGLLATENGAGTGEVADAFDMTQPSAYRRLKRLEDAERVESRKIGGTLLWSVTDAADESEVPA